MQKTLTQLTLATAVFFSRFNFLPSNISPLGSFGFFSANPLFFALSIIAFDAFHGGFYSGFLFTYAGFAAYWLLGRLAARSHKLQALLLPLASFSFFALSNFGVWWSWYPHTLEGLLTCYTLALPFYQNTLIGDVVFGYGFLGYSWLKASRKETQSIALKTA
jgi:hypothetical protein